MMKMYGAVAIALLLVAFSPTLNLVDCGERADWDAGFGDSCGPTDCAGPGFP